MKCRKKQKTFFCSGSDSGISCDDNVSSSANEVAMENVNIEKNTNNKLNKSTCNKAIHDSKLVSRDNIDHYRSFNAMELDNSEVDVLQAIQEKLKSHVTIKKVKSPLPTNIKKGSINLRKRDNSTVFTKCFVDDKDEWNKYLLGKAKPTKQKPRLSSTSSQINEELNLQNESCVNVSSVIDYEHQKSRHSSTISKVNEELNLPNETCVNVSSVVDPKSTKQKTQHNCTSSKINEKLNLQNETCKKVNENSLENSLETSTNLLNILSSEVYTKNANSPKKKSKHDTKYSSEKTELNKLKNYKSIKKYKTKNLSEIHPTPDTCTLEQPDSVTNTSLTVLPRTKSERIRKLYKRNHDEDVNNVLNDEIFVSELSNSQHKKRKRISSESSILDTCHTKQDHNNSVDNILKSNTSTQKKNLDQLINRSFDQLNSKSKNEYYSDDNNDFGKIISLQDKNIDQLNNSNFDKPPSKSKKNKKCTNYQENNGIDLSTVEIKSLQEKKLDEVNNSDVDQNSLQCKNQGIDLSASQEKNDSSFDDLNSKTNYLKKCSEHQITSPKKKHLDQLNNSSLDKPSKSRKSKKCSESEDYDNSHLSTLKIVSPEEIIMDQLNDSSLFSTNLRKSKRYSEDQHNESTVKYISSKLIDSIDELNLKSRNTKLKKGIVNPHHEINTDSEVELCSKNITNETNSDIGKNGRKSKSPKKSRHKENNENDLNTFHNLESLHNTINNTQIIECNTEKINHVEENTTIENMEVCPSNTVDQLVSTSNSPTLTRYSESEEDITLSQLDMTDEKSDYSTIRTANTKSNCSPNRSKKKEITQLESQEKTSEIEAKTVSDNKWEELRNKYSDIYNCDLNPYVILTKLILFSKNDWISKVPTNENISVENKQTTHTTVPEKNITTANNDSQTKINSPVALRNVCVILKDLKYDNIKTSKQIKLSRNFNISSPKHRSKTCFRYKFKNNFSPLTSRDVMFSGVQLTEGFKFSEILKKVNNENDKQQKKPEIFKSKPLLKSESLIKGVSFDKKENMCTNNINTDETIQNITESDGSTVIVSEKSGENILQTIEKPDSLYKNEKEMKLSEKSADKLIKKPDKNYELKCFGITRITPKLHLNNKMNTTTNNTLIKLNKEYKNIYNKIESSSSEDIKVVHEENTKKNNSITVKNKVNLTENPKSVENDNIESESILSIEQFIKDGIKEPCAANKNEKSTHHNKEQKKNEDKDLSKISESKKLDSQISSSNKQIETATPKPKHVFKFVDETNVKRPPTRIKLDRPISSHTFKVPQSSPSNNVAPHLSPKQELESPRFSTKISKKHEKEFDSISIYAETIEVDGAQNDSESDFEKFDTPEVNIMKVNHWLIENDQNIELSNKEQPVKENNNKISDNEVTNDKISSETNKINTENNRASQNSVQHDHDNINPAILYLSKVCNKKKIEGVCRNSRCKYQHNLKTLKLKLPKLSTADLFDLYETMKKKSFFYVYKFLFSDITVCLGNKRDFNKLISMVKDVLEIRLNSDRAPFIKNIIDALCSTGVAFHSIVEVVYKNANVSEILMNLLRDILLNLIVDQKKTYESWPVIKDIINNEKYDLDNGIIKLFIVECLENEVYGKELSYKVYHEVLKKISDSKLTSLVESLQHNFYYTLMKFSYINEANELCTRCHKLDVNIGANNVVFSSPESATKSSSNDSAIMNTPVSNQSSLQNNPTFDQNFDTNTGPVPVDSSQNLNPIESVPNIEMPPFTRPPPSLPNPKTELFTVPPPLIIKRPVTEHTKNVYQQKPVFKRYKSHAAPAANVSSRQNNSTSKFLVPVRSNNKSNLYTTSVKPSHPGPPTNTYTSSSPNYALCRKVSATIHEVNQAIYEKNVLKIHTLISTNKDNDFTDTLIKIFVETIVKSDIDVLWFFQELWNTTKCLCTVEDNSLSYVLKTICLNLTLHLSKNQNWNHALVMSNILRNEFKDIFNVKIYLEEPYSYCRRILILARIYAKNKECVKAWGLVSETFQDDSCENTGDKSLRNFVIEEILNVTNTNKMWNIGLQILIFLINKDHSGVDIKRRVSVALLHAINSKCGMNFIMEFTNSIGSWSTYVSNHVFRSIVVHAVSNEYWKEAIEFYTLGCTYEIYTPIVGNERCIIISNQLVLEEIWLIFQIYLSKRYELGPIKNNVIVKISEVPQTVSIDEIPNNLRQYNINSSVLRARVANVLNNYIKPAIKILNDKNFIILQQNEINNHILSKIVSMPV